MGTGSRGLVLLSVLWVTTLLAVFAAGLTSSSRTESHLARNQLENARAEALADAGVYRAILGLLAHASEGEPWRADGEGRSFRFANGVVSVWIEDEDAKIDVNVAPLELIAGLLQALEMPEKKAQVLAERIGDFRDVDATPNALGAEDPAYAQAGLAHGAKDAPMADLDELAGVLGMTAELQTRMRPHLTVLSRTKGVDPLRASRTVLAAIPGITPGAIEAFADAEPDADPSALIDQDLLFEIEYYLRPSREVMYTIRAEGRSAGGGVFVREAQVELFGGGSAPFQIYSWRRGRAR